MLSQACFGGSIYVYFEHVSWNYLTVYFMLGLFQTHISLFYAGHIGLAKAVLCCRENNSEFLWPVEPRNFPKLYGKEVWRAVGHGVVTFQQANKTSNFYFFI